jgi:hypothetical protein
MKPIMFKPKDYNSWTIDALAKIHSTIDSCTTLGHIATVQTMIDNFVIMLLLNDDYSEDYVRFISRQLYLYLNLKKSNLNASN